MKNKAKNWWLMLLKGIILIVLSFFVFRHPIASLIGLVTTIGFVWMLTGIFLIIASIMDHKVDDKWGYRLLEGIIDVIFAGILLSHPGITAIVLPFIIGFWIIVNGVTTFCGSFISKKESDGNWWHSLFGGILSIFFGWFVMTDFFAGAIAITFWIGLGLLMLGIVNISLSLRLKKLNTAIN
jgi:uncharacterized membrane protein HdeD (DUF308 family)